ncbi:MAG: GYD domain-containing protein [Actinobacteria bacterium]|nr:GYD domain-containing protein [Actinomycetota bacterium]
MTYIFLLRNDASAARNMLLSGTKGAVAQAELLRRLGATEVKQFAVTGRFDAVVIADLPSQQAALAFSLGATSEGQYVELLPAHSAEDVDEARRLAEEAVALPDSYVQHDG